MCGIVGVVNPLGSAVASAEVEQMLATILPRGPDHHAVSCFAHLGFGHARLSVLDLSERGNQPFVTADGQGVLVYNGEVFNFLELRLELQAQGVEFVSGTDTEVVLQALHAWGPMQAIPRLNGMFALAYADLRVDSVWLARDRFGIKPLFTARTANGLLFASEQKALLAHCEVSRDIDMQSVISLLLYERFNGIETSYQEIDNFTPGTILEITNQGCSQYTFFDVLRDIEMPAIADESRSFADSRIVFERALVASVEKHLVSDAPYASLCSGGLDSGLVTAIAARRNSQLVSYVADMEGMQGEELRRAQRIADHVGTELRCVTVDRTAFLGSLPFAVAANDQPLFFAQEVAMYLIAQQMRRDGFKVALSGDGADELFGGYDWYTDVYRRWNRLDVRARWLPNLAVLKKLSRFVPGLLKPDLEQEIANYALTAQPIEYVATSLNMAFVGGMKRTLRQRELFDRLADLPLPERAFLASNFEDIYVHMRESLNSKDKVTMCHGIESRVPFMENALIRFGMGLPVSHKYRRGKRKALIHQMASSWLPDDLIDLPKIGFAAPPVMWANTFDLLRDGHVADLLKWPRDKHGSIVRLLEAKPRYGFRLLGCELWLKMHRDGMAPGELSERLLHSTG